MNAVTIPTIGKSPSRPSGAQSVSFCASKGLAGSISPAIALKDSFESGEVVLVRVVSNKLLKQIRLADLSLATPKEGDIIAAAIAANASFKIDVVQVPPSPRMQWVIINRGGIVGQPVVVNPESLVVEYVGTFVENGIPVRLTDMLKTTFVFGKPIIAVAGTETSTGKTTTVVKLIRELKQLGLRVGACKLTGIFGDDTLAYSEAGADQVLDFSDAGLSSTAFLREEAVAAALKCVSSLQENDVIVAELGSSLFGGHPVLDIIAALRSPQFKLVVCCSEVAGAIGAAVGLSSRSIQPVAFTGIVANSKLACSKVAELTRTPCVPVSCSLTEFILSKGVANVELC